MFDSTAPNPKPKDLIWHYVQVKPGSQIHGWIAGPMIGVTVHWSGHSTPCIRCLTGGRRECSKCQAGLPTRWIGYLPVIDMRGRRVVVIVPETIAIGILSWAPRTAIEIWRTSGARDPLKVGMSNRPELTRLPAMMAAVNWQPEDIRAWLLQLWKCPELNSTLEEEDLARSENKRVNDGSVMASSTDAARAAPEELGDQADGGKPDPSARKRGSRRARGPKPDLEAGYNGVPRPDRLPM